MTRYSGFIVGELICEFSTSRKSSLSPSCLALIRSSSGSSEPFGASISTRPSSGTASTSIGSWIDSPPITTSGVSTPDWVDGRPSSDAARLSANRRIYMTSPGNPTVPVSSTLQLLRDQQFAIVSIVAGALSRVFVLCTDRIHQAGFCGEVGLPGRNDNLVE